MKIHSQRNIRNKRLIKIGLAFLVVLLIGIYLPKAFGAVGRMALYPVHVTNQWLRQSSSNIPTYFRDRQELSERIIDLENELAIAVSTSLTQQRLIEENSWLRELLSVENKPRIAAAVIARPGELPYDFLQIDQGSDDGIIEGAPVYIGSDNVIGFIYNVAPTYAFVELFTTTGFSTTAFVSGPDVIAIIEGHGGGVARVRVPQGVPLAIGNVVHLPSLNPGAFGRIDYIENQPSQPEQFGYVTLSKPISGINYVAVGKEQIVKHSLEDVNNNISEIIRENLTFESINLQPYSATSSASSTSESDL